MATQKQVEKQGDGGGQQAITVQRDQQNQQLSRERIPTARRLARTSPFSMMRRMLDDLGDLGTWGGPLGMTSSFGGISPFSTMRRMFDSMEQLFDTFDTDLLGNVDVGGRAYGWIPGIEIRQRQDALVVRADLPGVPQDQIRISADDNSLVIEGERQLPGDQQEDVLCSECAQGRFRRVVALPQGADLDKAEARYENGVLEVTVPVPSVQARGRRIEIQSAGKDQGQQNPPLAEGTAKPQQAEKH